MKPRRVLRNESTEDARRIWDFVEKAAARTKLPRAVKPAGWLYKVIVNLRTGPSEGLVEADGVWGTPGQTLQFSTEEPKVPYVYWKTPVYVAEEVKL